MSDVRPDVFNANCDSRQVLTLLGDRWTMLVIYALSHRARRHAELKRTIGGISQKMLTQTLRALERDGLVKRRAYPTVPPHVEYRLTALGRTILQPLRAVCRWAEKHVPEVRAARERAAIVSAPRSAGSARRL
jgi:DNA-binding HxlR family transcriptional regulator